MARNEQFTEYKAIAATDIGSFNELLEEHAQEGWIPFELCVTPDHPAGNHADDYGMQYTTLLKRHPGMADMAASAAEAEAHEPAA